MLSIRKTNLLFIATTILLSSFFFADSEPCNKFSGVDISSAIAGDAIAGKLVYNRCIGCHSLKQNRTGPKHCGLLSRQAGSVADFDYSKAMTQSGIVWSDKTLDTFLKSPMTTIVGTKMGYAGVKDDKERGDLIAYLKQASQSAECR